MRNYVSTALQYTFALVWLALISSCGGGGNATQPVPAAVAVSSRIFTLSSSTSEAMRASVVEVVSPLGAAKPGSALEIQGSSLVSTAPILAVNAQGQVLMATTVSGSSELSADSTAIALLYWIIGPDLQGSTFTQLETRARISPSFKNLVAAVALAQENAAPITTNTNIQTKLFDVLRETTAAPKSTSLGAATKILSQIVAEPRVSSNNFEAVMGSFGPVPLRLVVSDVNFVSAIRVTNSSPLFWSVRTEKKDGTPLSVLSTDYVSESYGILPGASIASSILSNIPIVNLFPVIPSIDLQDLPSEGFNIRIAQTKESKTKNWEAVFYQSIKSFMKISLASDLPQADKCYLSMATFTLQSVGSTISSTEPNISNLKSMLSRVLSDGTRLFDSCAPELFGSVAKGKELFKRYASIYFSEVTALYGAYEALGQTNNIVTVVAQLVSMKNEHSKDPYLYGICERNGPLKNGTITPCLTSLKFKAFTDPETGLKNTIPSFLVGSKLTFDIEGMNMGEPALLPASIKLNNNSAGVIKADLDSRLLEATRLGPVSLEISDASTGVLDQLAANVVIKANMKAEKTTLKVGDSTKLRLIDGNGNTVFTSGSDLKWTAQPPDVVSLFASTGSPVNTAKVLKASVEPVVITAALDNLKVGELSLTINGDLLVLASPVSAAISAGGTQQLSAAIKDSSGNLISPQPAVTWSSANPSIATVSSGGLVTAVAIGSTTVRIVEPVSAEYVDVPISVTSGRFAFEVAQINPIYGNGNAICTPAKTTAPDGTSAYPQGSSVSYDRCTSPKGAVVRCVGEGCTSGRFFAAVSQSRLVYTSYCLAAPIYCVGTPTGERIQEVYGPVITGQFDRGPGWFALNNGGWTKAWQSISDIGPSNPFVINVVTDFVPGSSAGFGNPTGANRVEVVYTIYDSQERTYSRLPVTVTAP